MSKRVYSPSIKDFYYPDIIARTFTLLLWFGLCWICYDLFNLVLSRFNISLPGPDIIDRATTMDVLLLLFNLIGVAYLISIFFFVWHFFVDAYTRAKPSRSVQLDEQKLGELFGLTVAEIQLLQTQKCQTIEVRDDGTIEMNVVDNSE